MTDATERDRIERMLAQGKLNADEAERLRRSLDAHLERLSQQRTAIEGKEGRRLSLVVLTFCVLFVLGATVGWLMMVAGSDSNSSQSNTTGAQVAPMEGRLIHGSDLAEERSITMNRSLPLAIGVLTVGMLAVVGALLVFLYNGLIVAREQVNAGWAQVENVYQRRLDLVPLLVDAVQSYTDHERETLSELTRARANAMQVGEAVGGVPQTAEQIKAIEVSQGQVESALARLLAIVESYPDLKASRNFLSLQDQIEGTENRVTIERRSYNEFSRQYNTRLQTFPGNVVAAMMGFAPKPYFEASSEALKGVSDPFGHRQGG